ncbi:Palmitoyltransferase [Umbelopsis nana]
MVYYNYYLACSTDPGKVPLDWEPPATITQPSEEAKRMGVTAPRFCKSCNVFKPPRSHHCSACRRCVLKMDHHCPWINNCVGYDNYGHFLRFIIYVDLATLYVLILLIWRVRSIMDDIRHFRFYAEPSTTEIVFLVVNFVLDIVVLMCVGVLSCYHIYCVAKNQSTIESWERSKVEGLIRRGKIPPTRYPFSIGIVKNIKSVLGPNPLLWLWPQGMPSDGLNFPVSKGIDPRSAYIWPPRDPDDLRPSIFSRNRSAAPGRGGARKAKYHPRQGQRHHVRRDSEGYLVRELTAEERTTMVESYVNTEDVEVYEMGPHDQESYVNPEDEYYDSGSAITDSGDEYTFTEDEENMRSAVNGYEYPPDGYTEEDAHWDQYVAADYAGRQDGMYDQHGDSYSIDSEEDDGDDTPLATLIPKTTISTKGRKKD